MRGTFSCKISLHLWLCVVPLATCHGFGLGQWSNTWAFIYYKHWIQFTHLYPFYHKINVVQPFKCSAFDLMRLFACWPKGSKIFKTGKADWMGLWFSLPHFASTSLSWPMSQRLWYIDTIYIKNNNNLKNHKKKKKKAKWTWLEFSALNTGSATMLTHVNF